MDPYFNSDLLVKHGNEALEMIAKEITEINKYKVIPDV